ncbi:MAG: ATP-binding protein [Leptospirales bacterium]
MKKKLIFIFFVLLSHTSLFSNNVLKENVQMISLIPEKLVRTGENTLVVRFKVIDGQSSFRNQIRFASEKQVNLEYLYDLIKRSGITAILVFLGLFFGAYYFTKKQVYYLYFAATSLAIGLWQFAYQGMAHQFIDTYWPAVILSYTSAIPTTAFLVMFFHTFFEIKLRTYIKVIITAFYSIIFLLWVEFFITGGVHYFTEYIFIPYLFCEALGHLYLIYIVIYAIILKKEMAWRMLFGLSFIYLAMSGLVLGEMELLGGNYNYVIDSFFAMIIVFASVLRTRDSAIYKELEKAYTNLKSLDKIKDEFLANTSHELRTPLQTIINLVESILQVNKKLNTKIVEQLNLVKFSARRLSYLVDDILDFSKIKEGDIRLNIENHSLSEQVTKVIALTVHLSNVKNIQIIHNIEPNIFIQADKERVQQILFNLIGNAIKFTEKGKIEIAAKTEAEKVEIKISDTGVGIDESKLGQIFDPFTISSDIDTKQYQGAGLGLAITRELLEKQNGSIKIQSKKGEGTEVTFELPAGIPVHGSLKRVTKIEARPVQVEMPEKMKNITERIIDDYVLIVDDDPVIISILADILESENIRAVIASDGKVALEILSHSGKPVLVILDINMPDISGIELCKKIRNKFDATKLPILMFTAKTRFKDLTHAINSGATDFLTKPVDYNEFILRVQNLLNMSYAEKDKRKLLKKQREEIFYDLHDHLGGFLTDMQFTVKALSIKKGGDNHFLQELKDTIDKTILIFRERLNYIEDLTMISKNFFSGLQQILLRRYVKTGRGMKFNVNHKLFEKIMDEQYGNIRNDLFSIVTEIATNDLKYGKDITNWNFLDKQDSLFLTIKTKSNYNLVKNGTGLGTSTIMQQIAALHGNLQLNYEQGEFIINISIPWNQSEKIIDHAS